LTIGQSARNDARREDFMYVVFGASGHTGSVVAEKLIERGKRVRAVARDATKLELLRLKGAEVVTADVLDAGSVANALRGAEGAYLLIPPDNTSSDLVARGCKITDNYVAGLSQQGVRNAAVLSSVGAQEPSGTGPIVITHYAETTLPKAASTTFTFVRAAYFMENLLAFAQAIKNDGVLPVFGGGEGHPFPMVATGDIGETAADAILSPPSAAHQWIELSGPREYSFNDAAAEAAAILGRPVKATALPIDALVPTMTQFGFSANVAGLYREMNEAFGTGLVRFEGNRHAVRGQVPLGDVLRAGLR
jgi:uncharacterized protein YbjT (DUF2867 family)